MSSAETLISLEDALALLIATERASGEGFISIDAENMIVLASPLLEKMWGYEQGELVGKPVQTLIPPHYRADHTTGVQRFAAEDRKATAFNWAAVEAYRKDGTTFPIHIRIVRVADSERFLLAAAVRSAVPYHQVRGVAEEALMLAEQGAERVQLVESLRRLLDQIEQLNLAAELPD
jgi:PAS domain S-box-containing protein